MQRSGGYMCYKVWWPQAERTLSMIAEWFGDLLFPCYFKNVISVSRNKTNQWRKTVIYTQTKPLHASFFSSLPEWALLCCQTLTPTRSPHQPVWWGTHRVSQRPGGGHPQEVSPGGTPSPTSADWRSGGTLPVCAFWFLWPWSTHQHRTVLGRKMQNHQTLGTVMNDSFAYYTREWSYQIKQLFLFLVGRDGDSSLWYLDLSQLQLLCWWLVPWLDKKEKTLNSTWTSKLKTWDLTWLKTW